ncbi:FAD-binding oxidoreductase [Aquamicrobium segne]|uniref:FAD-binding oxidoreductase n=1 Tax=Aquamicrobium segne TaxID=469547 RepID=A0ABW0H1Z7_9HYPH
MSDPAQLLSNLLGPRGWLAGGDAAAHMRDWLDRCGAPPLGVARPATTREVAEIVRLCAAHGLAIVPQGGNTGLCCAAIDGQGGNVILSLARMNRIGQPDQASGSVEVEAGAVLAALHESLASHGLIFPMHLGAEGSAQIGGLIGTNAGGSHALRYGMMQDLVLGLEVVLADGTVWDGMRAVQKDNAGYQLRRLFCGAEGTLGIVTCAVLRLYPAPRRRASALLVAPGLDALVEFGTRLRAEAGEFLSGLEFFGDTGLGFVLDHVDVGGFPLSARGPAYLLVELASASDHVPLDDILLAQFEHGVECGLILDGVLAASDAQRAHFWKLREELPEGQRLEGPQLKHDISVPPGRIAAFVSEAGELCGRLLPGVRANPFGHLGDGNIHYNLSPPPGAPDFGEVAGKIGTALAALATGMSGSFAAEHGLGRTKIALADATRGAVERRLMATLKQALDPAFLFNPDVIVARNAKE